VSKGGVDVKQLMLILALSVAVLTTATTAFAGGSSVLSGHTSQPPAAQVLATQHPKTSAGQVSPATTKSGTLPFTGMNLGIVAGGALLLIAAGGALRRSSRQKR
jgi:hypothetical protein